MLGFFLLFSEPMGNGGGVQIICMHHRILLAFSSVDYILQKKVIAKVFYSCSMFKNLLNLLGTIHLRRRHALGGGGVKNLPNLPTDSTKKLPTVGG